MICVVCHNPYSGSLNSDFCSPGCKRKSPAELRRAKRRVKRRRERYRSDPVYREQIRKRSVVNMMRSYRRNPMVRVKMNLRKRIRDFIKSGAINCSRLIGCNSVELRRHLECMFEQGMTWDNYGTFWVIDHKLPLASFDLREGEQRAKACHFTNLQPMTRIKNLEKSDTVST